MASDQGRTFTTVVLPVSVIELKASLRAYLDTQTSIDTLYRCVETSVDSNLAKTPNEIIDMIRDHLLTVLREQYTQQFKMLCKAILLVGHPQSDAGIGATYSLAMSCNFAERETVCKSLSDFAQVCCPDCRSLRTEGLDQASSADVQGSVSDPARFSGSKIVCSNMACCEPCRTCLQYLKDFPDASLTAYQGVAQVHFEADDREIMSLQPFQYLKRMWPNIDDSYQPHKIMDVNNPLDRHPRARDIRTFMVLNCYTCFTTAYREFNLTCGTQIQTDTFISSDERAILTRAGLHCWRGMNEELSLPREAILLCLDTVPNNIQQAACLRRVEINRRISIRLQTAIEQRPSLRRLLRDITPNSFDSSGVATPGLPATPFSLTLRIGPPRRGPVRVRD